mgnify:CR=1 FL=1
MIIETSTDNSVSRILTVTINCNALKGEIATEVTHEPEYHHLGDPCDTRTAEQGKVRIAARRFVTYSRTPGDNARSLARSMLETTLRTLPGIPVELFGA